MTHGTHPPAPAVRYDGAAKRIIIHDLVVSNPEIVVEAHHWAAGHRGPAVNDDRLAQANLTMFALVALDAGSRAIQAARAVRQSHHNTAWSATLPRGGNESVFTAIGGWS